MSTARDVALLTLLRIEEGANAGAALNEALNASDLDARDRGLVTELTDGTLRRRGQLDYVLAQFMTRRVAGLDAPLRAALRLGAYQILHLRVPAHAAVDESVSLVRRHGNEAGSRLANAVLRKVAAQAENPPAPDPEADPALFLAITESHPEWLVRRWLARFGFDETLALLRANNVTPPVTLRANRRWVERDALQRFLTFRDVETVPTAISPWGLTVTSGGDPHGIDLYHEGLFTIQGEGSMVMVELLRPGRNRAGWDLCAGVGGKTTHLAEWVDDSGTLLATDASADRLDVLRAQMARLELNSITVQRADACVFAVPPDSMDYALLDAPCSGTGALRRQADARWRKAPKDIPQLAELQRNLLAAGARAVKPGGFLLYCTCSLEPEENAEVVAAFLAEHPDWALIPAGDKHTSLPDDARAADGTVHLLPHRHNTDGFFAAKLQRAP
jgi:16S rRNA (cytosine967-C5)-methyltransferase